jgi:hypothetical protein
MGEEDGDYGYSRLQALAVERMKMSASPRDLVEKRILEVNHEQERTFCKFGW